MPRLDEKDAVGIMVLLSVSLGTCMSALDASVVNTVLPVIREEFHVPVGVIQWVSTTYLLIMGSLLLTFGRLGDLRGHKPVYLAGLVVFVPASVLCGISPSVELLIAARVLQGIGAAIVVSTAPAILIGSVSLSAMNGETSLHLVVIGLVVTGIGVSIFVTPNNSAMLGAAPPGRKGIASGILATSRLLGMATGVSIAGAILATIVGGRSAHGISPERVFKATHLAFLAAGLMASAGTLLTAARSEGKDPGQRSENPVPVEGIVAEEADPIGQAPT